MNSFVSRIPTVALVLVAFSRILAEEPRQASTNHADDPDAAVLRRVPDFFFTTEAYQREALRVFIEEANRVARELSLERPFTITNLIEVFISPPGSGAMGLISTTNYAYMVGSGRKFCGITQRNHGETFEPVKKAYTWPISRLDTNREMDPEFRTVT
jgi:hypothetical protein